VEARVADHLSTFRADGEQYEVVEVFPHGKIGNMGIANFLEFYSQN